MAILWAFARHSILEVAAATIADARAVNHTEIVHCIELHQDWLALTRGHRQKLTSIRLQHSRVGTRNSLQDIDQFGSAISGQKVGVTRTPGPSLHRSIRLWHPPPCEHHFVRCTGHGPVPEPVVVICAVTESSSIRKHDDV